MLKPDFLFRQQVLWEKRIAGEVNRAVYEAGIRLPCCAQIRIGCEAVKGRIFLPAACPIGPGDRLTLDGRTCFAAGVQAFPSHVECEIA